jgi:hypothetical protein
MAHLGFQRRLQDAPLEVIGMKAPASHARHTIAVHEGL